MALDFFFNSGGRKEEEEEAAEEREWWLERGEGESFSPLYFPFRIVILGSDFVPILAGREGGWVSFSSLLLSSAHLTSPPLLLPRLSVGSAPVTAIAAVLRCPPRGAHRQVRLHFPIA